MLTRSLSPSRLIGTAQTRDVRDDWSPDGRTIACVALDSGASQIYALDSGGNGSRRLTWNACSDIRLTWRPS